MHPALALVIGYVIGLLMLEIYYRFKRSDFWFLREYYKNKISDRFYLWFVWRLPKRLIMWSSVRLIAYATTGKYATTVVPELTAMDALGCWDDKGDSNENV